MASTGSIINRNSITMFVAAFVGTLMAVFTASAIAPDNSSVVAHTVPVRTSAHEAVESVLGDQCSDPSVKTTRTSGGQHTNTISRHTHSIVKKVIHNGNNDNDVVDTDIDTEVNVGVEDVIDINDNYVPIISHNNVLNNTLNNNLSNNDIDLGVDDLLGLLN